MTTTEHGPNASGRMVLAFMAFCLVIIFAASFLYRLERPTLEVQQKKGGQGGMPGNAMMPTPGSADMPLVTPPNGK